MATVMFSTIGQALGGPLGAVAGALVGGTVDSAIFGRGRGGGNLLVQRSAYGEVIPRLYGAVRVAGSVIWALPMKTGGSKGSGRKAYATSFAVALSSRPVRRIGRIWADGSEIRNSDGEFAVETRMRFYPGDGRQKADPIIVAAESAGGTPAYQGLAYVVFEDFAVGDFGNRIPNLSFEVFADDAAGPDGWLHDLGGLTGINAGFDVAATAGATGYAAGGSPWSDDIRILAQLGNADTCWTDGGLRFASTPRVIAVAESEILMSGRVGTNMRRISLGERPRSFSIDYADPERDYQAGRQLATRRGGGNALVMREPVTATASMARHIADRQLRRAEAATTSCEITLSWRWLGVTVGDILVIGDIPDQWRVVRRDIDGMLVRLEAQLLPAEMIAGQHEGDSGRALPDPLVPVPITDIAIFEAPLPLRADISGAGAWVTATGGVGWRGAELRWSFGNGETFLGEVFQASPTGHLLAPLFEGPAEIWDERNSLLVAVQGGDFSFESRTGQAVLAGANLVRVGAELLQFRTATMVGPDTVRLSGLLRGRSGTEHAIRDHPAGTKVHLLIADQLLFVPIGGDAVGRELTITAIGRGDPAGGAEESMVIAGHAVAPLAPVHLRAERHANHDIAFSWVSRDRSQFEWSGNSIILEQAFRCHIRAMVGADLIEQSIPIAGERFLYAAAAQADDFGGPLGAFTFSVVADGDGPETVRASRWHDIGNQGNVA